MSMPTTSERRVLAELVGVDEQYLYQCLTGRKDMKTAEAVRVEEQSGFRLRRWQLRTNDWWKHWPELVGVDGAPDIPPEELEAIRRRKASEAEAMANAAQEA